MYKLLIVDDEYNIRQGLITTIPWKDIDVEVVGEATNGLDALKKVRELKPDIIITDINMAKMNGLEIAEELKKFYPDIKIIIISGYDEFEYAKKAIELDVFSYLMKPLDEGEIIRTVKSLLSIIDEDRQLADKLKYLEKEFKSNLSIIKDRFINDLIEGVFTDGNEQLPYVELVEIKLENPLYSCAVFNMDGYYEFLKEHGRRATQMTLLGIKEIIHEILSKNYSAMETAHSIGNIITIISGIFGRDKKSLQALNENIDKVRSKIRTLMGVSVSIGVGGCYDKITEVRKSFDDAKIALSYKVVLGTDCSIHIDDIIPINRGRYIYPSDKERQILLSIDSADESNVCKAIDEFLDELKTQKFSKEYLSVSITGLLQIIARKFMDLDINFYHLFGEKLIDAYDAIKRFDTMEEISSWLIDIVIGALQTLNNNRKSDLSVVVKKAKDFILSNYSNPEISISSIADSLYLNANYFSNLFKRESGESCMDYIIKTRIDEAKRLLSNTNMRSSDVGSMVGYMNAQYFCTLFKKAVGKTPGEYRNG